MCYFDYSLQYNNYGQESENVNYDSIVNEFATKKKKNRKINFK